MEKKELLEAFEAKEKEYLEKYMELLRFIGKNGELPEGIWEVWVKAHELKDTLDEIYMIALSLGSRLPTNIFENIKQRKLALEALIIRIGYHLYPDLDLLRQEPL